MNLKTIDLAAFYESLDTLRQSRRLRWREVAAQSGVSSSTLIRMAQGTRPDEEDLAALVRWTGWSELQMRCYSTKFRESQSKSQPQTLIPEPHLTGDRNLTPEAVAALKTVVNAGYKRMREMKYQNYFNNAGKWMRRSSSELDLLCEEQRVEHLFQHDRFHYRQKAIASSYWYWRQQGDSRLTAYEKAQLTQLVGMKRCTINLDARTTIKLAPVLPPKERPAWAGFDGCND